jgi:DNA-binding transcriptional ArsR family regulator
MGAKGHRITINFEVSSNALREYRLAYMPIWAYNFTMPRAATTSDPFNAIAEPQRRRILTVLMGQERPVNDLARALRITPSRASKHLRVLREVGLVRVRGVGQHRLYGLDARGLKPIHEWVGGFEQFWSESFDRLNEYLQELQRKEDSGDIRE